MGFKQSMYVSTQHWSRAIQNKGPSLNSTWRMSSLGCHFLNTSFLFFCYAGSIFSIRRGKVHLWTSKIAQRVKPFATRSDDLSSIPQTCMVRGENQLPKAGVWPLYPHIPLNKQINVAFKLSIFLFSKRQHIAAPQFLRQRLSLRRTLYITNSSVGQTPCASLPLCHVGLG